MTDSGAGTHPEPSVGELVSRLSEQTSRLVREEMALAQAEMTDKAKHAGVGAGLVSGAGVLALFGLGTLIACAVLALDLVLDAWLAALIVGVVVLGIAGVAALLGRKQFSEATPAAPQRSIESVKQDVQTVKEASQRDHTTR